MSLTQQDADKVDMPILCNKCLGDNPYLRMTKEPHARACKNCERPFTVFVWKPHRRGRPLRTLICKSCSKLGNCCQSCVLDLELGIPTHVRDSVLAEHEEMAQLPEQDLNRRYAMEVYERDMADAEATSASGYDRSAMNKSTLLDSLRKHEPYYRAELKRGYRSDTSKPPPPPEDPEITTIFVGGIMDDADEQDVRDALKMHGEIEDVRISRPKKCAFVVFSKRVAAEEAMKQNYRSFKVKDKLARINWAHKQHRSVAPPPGMQGASASSSSSPADPNAAAAAATPSSSSASRSRRTFAPPPGIAPPPGMGGPAYYAAADSKTMQNKLM